ncbi:hypothetical protein A0H81_14097 [Grifola frondosa]|uniref:Uncharacterized protein n=1 Tax=Grifola frondosa TaxID=5627 RepID=A0A1C7LPH4_GRIFR|nr:hypothetical protein A0H81_14097 [Grifola frondosa]
MPGGRKQRLVQGHRVSEIIVTPYYPEVNIRQFDRGEDGRISFCAIPRYDQMLQNGAQSENLCDVAIMDLFMAEEVDVYESAAVLGQ